MRQDGSLRPVPRPASTGRAVVEQVDVLGVLGFSYVCSPQQAARLMKLVDIALATLTRRNGGTPPDLPGDLVHAVAQLRGCARRADFGATLSAALPVASASDADAVAEVAEAARQSESGTLRFGSGEVAGLWDVTPRRVRQLAAAGEIPATLTRDGWIVDAAFVRQHDNARDAVAAHRAHIESQDRAKCS